MRIGYVRVSKKDQNEHLQMDDLARAGYDELYVEKVSTGRPQEDRPQLVAALKALRAGDTLVIWKVDRLGRTFHELVRNAEDLRQRGVAIEILSPRLVFDDSPMGKLMFSMWAMLAEFERDTVRERTMAGLAAARARGRLGGRRPKMAAKDIEKAKAMVENGKIGMAEAAEHFGIARSTLYRHLSTAKDSRQEAGMKMQAAVVDASAGDAPTTPRSKRRAL